MSYFTHKGKSGNSEDNTKKQKLINDTCNIYIDNSQVFAVVTWTLQGCDEFVTWSRVLLEIRNIPEDAFSHTIFIPYTCILILVCDFHLMFFRRVTPMVTTRLHHGRHSRHNMGDNLRINYTPPFRPCVSRCDPFVTICMSFITLM